MLIEISELKPEMVVEVVTGITGITRYYAILKIVGDRMAVRELEPMHTPGGVRFTYAHKEIRRIHIEKIACILEVAPALIRSLSVY